MLNGDVTGARPAVAVVGAGDADDRLRGVAERVGALLAASGVVVVCGGLGGVMEAVCRGARQHGGRTVGILPGTDRTTANPFVEVVVPTGMGEGRNVLVVRAGQAVIAVGGGFGTLSEIALACKIGVPVFGLDTWPLPEHGVVRVDTPEAAVAGALETIRHREVDTGVPDA